MKKFELYGLRKYLIGTILVLITTGCGGDYLAEKMYWQANRLYEKIITSSTPVSKSEYQRVVNAYQKIIDTYPQWNNIPMVQFFIGQVYLEQKDFTNAEKHFIKLVRKYPSEIEVCSKALFSIGTCREKKGDWENALKLYNQLLIDYPWTEYGLIVPLHIAQYYQERKNQYQSTIAYEKAIQYYRMIYNKPTNPTISGKSESLLLTCYIDQEKWEDAIELLRLINICSPNSEKGKIALYRLANLYEDKIKDSSQALVVYKEFVAKYPTHHLAESARIRINTLNIIKG